MFSIKGEALWDIKILSSYKKIEYVFADESWKMGLQMKELSEVNTIQ